MGLSTSLTILLVALIVLGFSSSKLVGLLTGISNRLKFPKFLVSFVVLGLGTSLPDLFITTFAAAQQQTELVLATLIGANIIVICLVLGVVTIIKGDFRVRESTVLDNFGYIVFILVIPFFLMFDGKLTQTEGVILVIIYLMYIFNIKEQEAIMKKEEEETHQVFYQGLRVRSMWAAIGKLIFFLALAYVSSNYIVSAAVEISTAFNIAPMLMGFTVLSLGIAIPEFFVDLSALRAREEEVIWGDLIGSFVTELTFVLGIAVIVAGNSGKMMEFELSKFLIPYAFMAFSFLMVFLFAYKKKELSRREGIMLVAIYFIFLAVQYDLIMGSVT